MNFVVKWTAEANLSLCFKVPKNIVFNAERLVQTRRGIRMIKLDS